MSINRTSVKNNRRSIKQYNNPIKWIFYVTNNTDRYDLYYDTTTNLEQRTIDMWWYIAVWHTNLDISAEYGSVCYYIINKSTGVIWTIVKLQDLFDVESWIVTKYLNWHLYLSYTRWNPSYTDIDLIAGTWNNYYNTEYTGSAVAVNNDWVINWWYLIKSDMTYQDTGWYEYYKQWIKFISQ